MNKIVKKVINNILKFQTTHTHTQRQEEIPTREGKKQKIKTENNTMVDLNPTISVIMLSEMV